jgi:hypothetical protein
VKSWSERALPALVAMLLFIPWASHLVYFCPLGIDGNLMLSPVLPRTDAHVAAPSESTLAVFRPELG